MTIKIVIRLALVLLLTVIVTGCTIHPAGESAERRAALDAGHSFANDIDGTGSPLPGDPTPDDLVQYVLAHNGELQQRYWEWRSAIEQIPQDGTQTTTLALAAGTTVTRGRTEAGNTTIGVLNDPMTDIHWPGTLATAAKRTLENARAAGLRFRQTQNQLRNKVLAAWYDYALTVELIRLEQSNETLLQTMVTTAEARARSGAAGQPDILKIHNDLDVSRNEIANMQSQLRGQTAAINALLSRAMDAAIPIPAQLPAPRPMNYSDDQLMDLAARRNPELAALAADIRGKREGIILAKLQYVPDFNISLTTDLAGIAQNLAGSATIPLLRYEAIDASIAQANANLQSFEAMRRQATNDLNARIVLDISTLRDADRQIALFNQTILPRAQQIVQIVRMSYESGQATLLDLLESRQNLVSIQRLVANLRTIREKQLADVESITRSDLETDEVVTAAK